MTCWLCTPTGCSPCTPSRASAQSTVDDIYSMHAVYCTVVHCSQRRRPMTTSNIGSAAPPPDVRRARVRAAVAVEAAPPPSGWISVVIRFSGPCAVSNSGLHASGHRGSPLGSRAQKVQRRPSERVGEAHRAIHSGRTHRARTQGRVVAGGPIVRGMGRGW